MPLRVGVSCYTNAGLPGPPQLVAVPSHLHTVEEFGAHMMQLMNLDLPSGAYPCFYVRGYPVAQNAALETIFRDDDDVTMVVPTESTVAGPWPTGTHWSKLTVTLQQTLFDSENVLGCERHERLLAFLKLSDSMFAHAVSNLDRAMAVANECSGPSLEDAKENPELMRARNAFQKLKATLRDSYIWGLVGWTKGLEQGPLESRFAEAVAASATEPEMQPKLRHAHSRMREKLFQELAGRTDLLPVPLLRAGALRTLLRTPTAGSSRDVRPTIDE